MKRTVTRVRVGDLHLDVEQCGDPGAEPVLLLHGFPQDRRAWDGVVPALTAAGLATLAPDQRGYSPGARPGVRARRGARLGSVVAWYLAARHPERVRTLTAISFPRPHPPMTMLWSGDDVVAAGVRRGTWRRSHQQSDVKAHPG